MSKVYARLSLFVVSSNEAVLAELDKRFTRRTETKWQDLAWDDDTNLAEKLDGVMFEELESRIEEFGDLGDASAIEAFQGVIGPPGDWNPGSNGQHESDVPVTLKDSGGAEHEWAMNTGEGTPAERKVQARVVWWTFDDPE